MFVKKLLLIVLVTLCTDNTHAMIRRTGIPRGAWGLMPRNQNSTKELGPYDLTLALTPPPNNDPGMGQSPWRMIMAIFGITGLYLSQDSWTFLKNNQLIPPFIRDILNRYSYQQIMAGRATVGPKNPPNP